jgi:uncharacterized protein (TIGR02646 family)
MLQKWGKNLRPISRGNSPLGKKDYKNYQDAKTNLIDRISSGCSEGRHIASYCSYCERKIDTNLAVEHIQPKNGKFGKPKLAGHWHNFLLACVNCNSTKGHKEVRLNNLFLPDRDNTFYVFTYMADGNIEPLNTLSNNNKIKANNTLSLVGLNKFAREIHSQSGKLIAQDRMSQRIEIWSLAETSLDDYINNLESKIMKKYIVKVMLTSGFFSVWMTVFKDYSDMRVLFINAISGTKESECFDESTGETISPHPNCDGLDSGGKI